MNIFARRAAKFLRQPVLSFYLLNDTFTTDRSAGAVNGTFSEPGPGGKRTVATDTGSKLSITGGAMVIASAAPGSNNPAVTWPAMASRPAGRTMIAEVVPVAGNGPGRVGWQNSVSSFANFLFGNSSILFTSTNGSNDAFVGAWAGGTTYKLAVCLRSSGAYYLIKGGAFTNWTLVGFTAAGSNAAPQVGFSATNAGAGISLNYVRVPSALWLPSPLASDGFSIWGTTDGYGHAEGVTGGIGAGGLGRLWTANVGTWGVSSEAAAASALTGSIAIATVDTGKADGMVTAKVTRSAGNAGIVARYADASNYVYAIHNGTNAQLIKRVATVETTLVNAAATYSAGAELRVGVESTKFRLYYNNVFIGTEQTIADAGLASGTKQGLYTSNTGNTFDNFVVYARGTSNEFAALDDDKLTVTKKWLFTLGDSKTDGDTWVTLLHQELGARNGEAWGEVTPRYGLSGYNAATLAAYVSANLSSVATTPAPSKICINIGANDIASDTTPDATTWKANLTAIVDALRARWPSADIYIAKPWRQGSNTAATAVAGYITTVISTYGSRVFAGPDESVWLKGSDDGATFTIDGVHYNTTTAQTICAAQWLAAMGY